MDPIRWREWGDEALGEAEARDAPILLFLVASWCRFCRGMERSTFGHPAVREALDDYVPVRVDKDLRPDIDVRYGRGGWPTTVFLTPRAQLITGGNYFEAEELLALLQRVKPWYREHRDRIEAAREKNLQQWRDQERRHTPTRLEPDISARVETAILENFDPEFGGFGRGQKFPHPEVIDFALVQHGKRGDDSLAAPLRRTLDGMMMGEIHDRVRGGFYRLADSRDWRDPLPEKTLEGNAGLLENYLEAWLVFGDDAYRRVAEGIVEFVRTILWDRGEGAFFGSVETPREGEGAGELVVERTVPTDRSARMVPALLRASVVLEDDGAERMALDALSFLLQNAYVEGRGAYHYWDGQPHMMGLLTDVVHLLQALVAAVMYAGDNRYLRPAEDLVEVLLRQHAAPRGGFYDVQREGAGPSGVGLPHRSILENATAAEALLRLSYLTRRTRYRDLAVKALEVFAGDYRRFGYFAAGFARAADLVFYPPLQVHVVGSARADRSRALLRAALARFVPSKIVQLLDPERDAALLEASGFPTRDEPVAYLCLERTCVGEITDPGAIGPLIEERERARRTS